MDNPKVYADFQNMDKQGRLRLICNGTRADLEKLHVSLAGGIRLLLSDGELEVEATVRWSDDERIWVGEYDEHSVRYVQ